MLFFVEYSSRFVAPKSRFLQDRNVSPLKVVQGLKNGHNINQVKLVKIIGDQMTSKEPKAELKMDIGLNKTSKETLMQSVRNLLNTSKERQDLLQSFTTISS